jgi:hypothetical protein
MKLNTNNSETFSSHQIKQQEFKITASAKAFKILSSNLYRNKIRAIIRELSTNALDAHISAGHPEKPFQLHLPSQLDPIFWIRDFGIGLSKEQVFSLYTTYFESTKSDSNDFVGALGLGSKSPFSYVDSFTVTSFYNGEKRIYDMSLKGGVPNVAELYSGTTDEENGLLISVSVNDNDLVRFRNEASYVYKTFKTKPRFVGAGTSVDLGNVVDHGSYRIASDSTYTNGVYAVMGNIAYPLANELVNGTVLGSMSNSRSVFIDFALGELDITPSREELSYDPDTEAMLKDRLDNMNIVLLVDILEKYKDETQPRDVYHKISQKEPHQLVNIVMNKVIIDGKSIRQWQEECKWENKVVHDSYKYRRVEMNGGEPRSKFRGKSSWDNDDLGEISRTQIKIFLNDDKKAPLQTLRGLYKLGEIKNEVVWMFDTHDINQKTIADDLIAKWGTHTGCKVFINSQIAKVAKDALPKGDPVKRGKPQNAEKYVLSDDGVVSCVKTQYYADDIDTHEGLYAFKFFDDLVDVDENRTLLPDTLKNYMIVADVKEVLVVRKNHWKRMIKNPKATSAAQAVADYVDTTSGRMVALKYGNKGIDVPSWFSRIERVFPNSTLDMIPHKKYNHKHKAYDLFNSLSSDYSVRKLMTKNASKQINRFRGTQKAIVINTQNISTFLDKKYYFLKTALGSFYSDSTVEKYEKEIKVLINLK